MDQLSFWRLHQYRWTLSRVCRRHRLYLACKRCMDIVLAALLLIITLPVLLLVAVLIKMDSAGPVFFRQERVGPCIRPSGGDARWKVSTFIMYKFRTMQHNCSPGVHQQFVRALIHGNETEAARLNHTNSTSINKLNHDARITAVGKFLRQSRIDELPQLWNVLKGEMSLVGPRPALLYEVAEYQPHHWRRLEAVPGCTGLWQVRGWCTLGFEEMVALDVWYVEHQSLRLDIQILLQTAPAVLSGTGGR